MLQNYIRKTLLPIVNPSFPIGTAIASDVLRPLARKYIWWKTPDDALAQPARVISQVMNLGDFADVQQLAGAIGDEVLSKVLQHAEAGEFNARSWAYWHYRLGLASVDKVPPLPLRQLG